MGSDTTFFNTMKVMRDLFCCTAAPDAIWSDGGPQLTSCSFEAFLRDWGVRHYISSPHYPQSNVKVEATIKSMKQLIKAAWRCHLVDRDVLSRSLLQYSNTPCRRDGKSPAQKLYGQDSLPAHRRSFALEWQRPVDKGHTSEALQKAESFYNQHAHPFPDLAPGAHIAVQNSVSKAWDIYGVVIAVNPHRRYFVRTQSAIVLVRNRRFLCKRTAISDHAPVAVEQQPTSQSPDQSAPRRSEWKTTRPKRLIEEVTWD